jgi:hypothetical protein
MWIEMWAGKEKREINQQYQCVVTDSVSADGLMAARRARRSPRAEKEGQRENPGGAKGGYSSLQNMAGREGGAVTPSIYCQNFGKSILGILALELPGL